MKASEFACYLDSIFSPERFSDVAPNGLEVFFEDKEISRLGLCVDLTLHAAKQISSRRIDFVITHHALMYGGLNRLVQPISKIFSYLSENQTAVYVAHLPMDAHPVYSHSRIIAKRVGLDELVDFPSSLEPYGVFGVWREGKQQLEERLTNLIGAGSKVIRKFCEDKTKLRVAIVSGSGGGFVNKAAELKIDILVSGEAKHSQIVQACNLGVDIWCFGHYNTEVFGLRALAEHLSTSFDFELVEMIELSIDN